MKEPRELDKFSIVESTKFIVVVPGYDELLSVLIEAYDRASKGKGHKRHSGGEPFIKQWILRGARKFGLGGLLYQIGKKNEEVINLETIEAKTMELLDIIVYAAAGIMLLREKKDVVPGREGLLKNYAGLFTKKKEGVHEM